MRQRPLRLGNKFQYLALLGVVAAGCSANSSLAAAGNTIDASPALTVRRNLLLSEGFDRIYAQASAASSRVSPQLKGSALNVYWGDYYNNTVAIYPRDGINPPEKGSIRKGLSHPQRLFVDGAFALYATNAGNNTVTVYKRHRTKPVLTISAGINDPTGLTVDAAGTVYCANAGSDSVTVYPKGQATPSVTIPIAGPPEYLAVDASDHLYVSYLGGSKGSGVMEFAPGSTSGKDLALDASGIGALEVDRSGNVIVADNYGSTIDVFRASHTEPFRRVGLGGGAAFGLSLGEKEHKLFVTVEMGGGFVVQHLDYPRLDNLTTELSTGAGNWPIAVSPDKP